MKKKWLYVILLTVSAVLSQAAFPPGRHVYLAFFSLLPLFYVIENGEKAFLKGFWWGFVYSLASIYWLSANIGTYRWIALLSTLLAALFLALQYGFFSWLLKLFQKKDPPLAWVLAPFLWVSLEILRSYGIMGFPFIAFGHSQAYNTLYIQAADIGGVYLIGFLLLLSNTSLYLLITRRKSIFLLPLILLIALPSLYGALRLSADWETRSEKVFRIVQPNIGAVEKWIPANRTPIVKTLDSLSLSAGYDSIDVVVWPESAAPLYIQTSGYHKHLMQNCARNGDFTLITGALDYVRDPETKHFHSTNSLFVFEPHHFLDMNNRYDKIHLVPFGEFTPGGKLLSWLNNMNYGQSDFISRESLSPLYMGSDSILFTPVICYDSVFPHTVRKISRNGGEYLIVITNDVWFGQSRGPYHHAALSIFRAVENRRPAVRSANAGISMFIDAKGRVIQSSALDQRVVMDQCLDSPDITSVYTSCGGLITWTFPAFSLLIIGLICLKRRS